MQPLSNPPATIVVLDEKQPLLPLNSQPIIIDTRSSRAKCWIKEHIPRAFVYGLFFYIMFNAMNAPFMQRKSNEKDIAINDSFQLESMQDVVTYNDNVFASGLVITCNDANKPTIPYEGLSEFEFDQETFPRLTIDQKTNTRRHSSLQISKGDTVVSVDGSLSNAVVKFDLKFDHEEMQDVFWIEQTEDEEQGVYSLIIRADEDYRQDGCVSIDISVRVPDVAALSTLAISLANNGLSLGKNLTFEHLAISIANGYIEFEDGISSGITAFAVANGHVSGKIDTLSNDLTSSVANGHNDISIKQVEQYNQENIDVKVVVANGHNTVEVPIAFNSQFKLESFVGRRIVQSSHPQGIHRRSGSWGVTSGYYGDDKDTQNTVTLKASSGNLKLNYA
ncbi:Amino-acid acetyltransferase, mitochondrial [Mucor velutinosus]|uniref:Amino-acid acetyltransferase, mitochondrial n=1 Tax=Mucor velutinosus TaxID=708070 RepID=A0AAN7D8I7_9FUNG|nr:Amino-acid acetyltransferase, mitochondrial [Mucor velutinosus]